MTSRFLLRRLAQPRIWERIWRERLTEPLHLNLVSLGVAACGSFRMKVAYDLVVRHHHAFCLLRAADLASALGVRKLTALEFGVARGAGLLNMCDVAAKVTRATGVEFEIYGFDSGSGMPPSVDWRDHPDLYRGGDFPMGSPDDLSSRLPRSAHLMIGELDETVPAFLREVDLSSGPIGFVSVDVDYYSSTVKALRFLDGDPQSYLPALQIYLDDVEFIEHSPWAGEQLAVHEFNQSHDLRKIARYSFLRNMRLLKNASWIDHIYVAHIFDHPHRRGIGIERAFNDLDNPYIRAA